MMYAGRIGSTFPLPCDQPFTLRTALEAGITRRDLETLVRECLLRRPIKGVYLPTHLGDSLALRVACLKLVVPEDCVVVDRHAGWLLGAQMVLAPNEHLELRPLSLFRPSGHGRLRNSLSNSGERNLTGDEVTVVDGLQVTTPLRTTWDLGRVRWPDQSISGVDAMLRLGVFTPEEFLDGIERFRRMRWITTLRAIGPLADGRSESPGESVLRLRCIEANVPVVPQLVVLRGSRFVARLDLGNEALMLGIEYDGVEWHSSPQQRADDRARRAELTEDEWVIRALRCEDVFGHARDCDRIIRVAAREARARHGGRPHL